MEYRVRDLVNSGQIVHVKAGNKILINFDRFLEFLSNPTSSNNVHFAHNHIRRII